MGNPYDGINEYDPEDVPTYRSVRGLCCGYDAPPVLTSIYYEDEITGAPFFCESCGQRVRKGGGHILSPPEQLIVFLISKNLLVPSDTRRQEFHGLFK